MQQNGIGMSAILFTLSMGGQNLRTSGPDRLSHRTYTGFCSGSCKNRPPDVRRFPPEGARGPPPRGNPYLSTRYTGHSLSWAVIRCRAFQGPARDAGHIHSGSPLPVVGRARARAGHHGPHKRRSSWERAKRFMRGNLTARVVPSAGGDAGAAPEVDLEHLTLRRVLPSSGGDAGACHLRARAGSGR